MASGDPERVARGNAYHLYREQYDIIAESYDRMHGHFPTGPAVTWAMTFAGSPSVPGARSFPDVFPATVEQGTPGPRRVPVVGWDNPLQARWRPPSRKATSPTATSAGRSSSRTPCRPTGGCSSRNPTTSSGCSSRPVGQRIEQLRLSERWPHLMAQLADWDVEVRQ